MNWKNLYAIYSLYVADWTNPNIDSYLYAENDEKCYEFLSGRFLSDDKDEILMNKWEIDMVDDNYDWYYNNIVYWWELIFDNVTEEEAKKIVIEKMLNIC